MGQLENLSLSLSLPVLPPVNSERKIGETRTISMFIVTTSLVARSPVGFVKQTTDVRVFYPRLRAPLSAPVNRFIAVFNLYGIHNGRGGGASIPTCRGRSGRINQRAVESCSPSFKGDRDRWSTGKLSLALFFLLISSFPV